MLAWLFSLLYLARCAHSSASAAWNRLLPAATPAHPNAASCSSRHVMRPHREAGQVIKEKHAPPRAAYRAGRAIIASSISARSDTLRAMGPSSTATPPPGGASGGPCGGEHAGRRAHAHHAAERGRNAQRAAQVAAGRQPCLQKRHAVLAPVMCQFGEGLGAGMRIEPPRSPAGGKPCLLYARHGFLRVWGQGCTATRPGHCGSPARPAESPSGFEVPLHVGPAG